MLKVQMFTVYYKNVHLWCIPLELVSCSTCRTWLSMYVVGWPLPGLTVKGTCLDLRCLQSSPIRGMTALRIVLYHFLLSLDSSVSFSNIKCVHDVMLSNCDIQQIVVVVFLYDFVQNMFPIWFPSPDSHISSSCARHMTAFSFWLSPHTSFNFCFL